MKTYDETPEGAIEQTRHRILTECVPSAVDSALGILRDPKASAQAKSATINSVFRAAGMFDRSEERGETDIHAMSPEQLERAIRKLGLEAEAVKRGIEPSIFD